MEKKNRIAIVSDAVYPFNKGGKEKRIYDISTRLAQAGNDVTIYCMKWWDGEKTIIRDAVRLSAISPLYPLYAGGRRSIKEAIFFAIHCLKLVNTDFDVIEVDHMPHLVLFTMKIVCLLKRKKMIVTWHEVWGLSYWRTYLGSLSGILAYAIEKTSAQLPDMIIAVSPHTAIALRDQLGVRAPILTVPNGLDAAKIMSYTPAVKGPDALFAGRLLSHKNVDVLLRAVALVVKTQPSFSLWIAGEGPERISLEAMTAELGLKNNVTFLGFLKDQEELYSIMHASRMFVLPSEREGFGIVVLEANACGIPVITIDHAQNAAKELIENGKNGIVTALNAPELARAIEGLLAMNSDRASYQAFAQKYDWNNVAATIKKIYSP